VYVGWKSEGADELPDREGWLLCQSISHVIYYSKNRGQKQEGIFKGLLINKAAGETL
jgi:hypothetical protein